MSQPQDVILDPVAAYDAWAPCYTTYSQSRLPYLQAVERLILARITGARSLLDVGAGDGSRALRIAKSAGIGETVLLEPSEGMRGHGTAEGEIWSCRASEIPQSARRFDVIICLWNVLGHIQGHADRQAILMRLKDLLTPSGTIFLDVNHRYNASAYGWSITFLRHLRDVFFWSERNGDVVLHWKTNDRTIRTRGHVFTQAELTRLFCAASLKIQRRWIVNYETGAEQRSPLLGNLLYELSA
jgi:2-polyprenyl-3-methyl-5-hydroxy-6-metoxy-1,4-benzoquinol methylase